MARLYSSAIRIGELLAEELKRDPHFYFFSPDETTSNKFNQVFEATERAWGDLVAKDWDLPESSNGRVIEMLSENVLFSLMTGHLANGETAMMGSYEAFYPIITAQLLQQMKFIKQSKATNWRKPMPAVNLLSTSTCWRQDHNGFTHQSPALISQLLSVPSGLANCLFPVDDIAAEETFKYMLSSKDVVNLATFDKNLRPRYTNPEKAKLEFEKSGAMIYDLVSDAEPDFVIAACGDIVAHEAIEAIKLIKEDLHQVKLRFVYINALSYRGIGASDNRLTREEFMEIFTPNRPILANFHGYPETLENILENYTERRRIRVHGFIEEGSTTTPFEMLRRNGASRYDLAIDIAKVLRQDEVAKKYQNALFENHKHAVQFGEDMIK